MCDPEERLAKGLTKEGGGRRDGRPALRRINNKEDYDPEERLAEDLLKEGGGRRDGRPALRRIEAG